MQPKISTYFVVVVYFRVVLLAQIGQICNIIQIADVICPASCLVGIYKRYNRWTTSKKVLT